MGGNSPRAARPRRAPRQNRSPPVDQNSPDYLGSLLAGIARTHLRVPTLEPRNSDSFDFVEASVWALRAALEEAYTCGYADAEARLGVAV